MLVVFFIWQLKENCDGILVTVKIREMTELEKKIIELESSHAVQNVIMFIGLRSAKIKLLMRLLRNGGALYGGQATCS